MTLDVNDPTEKMGLPVISRRGFETRCFPEWPHQKLLICRFDTKFTLNGVRVISPFTNIHLFPRDPIFSVTLPISPKTYQLRVNVNMGIVLRNPLQVACLLVVYSTQTNSIQKPGVTCKNKKYTHWDCLRKRRMFHQISPKVSVWLNHV